MSKKIIITGAGGGFGKLTVLSLLEKGHQVVGTMRATQGRNKEVAEELTQKGMHVVEMDVTKDEIVEQGVGKAIELLGGLDVVINNAGLGVKGMMEHYTPDDMKFLFDVNVFGPQRVNRAALPFLRAQGHGVLIHVSSLLGRMIFSFYGPYNATKWALEAMAENYRVELSGFGVESVIVEPGGYPTSFFENLVSPSDESRNESYGEFMQAPDQMAQGFGEALANNPAQKPQDVADAMVSLVEMPHGSRPIRTVVDKMGMGDHVEAMNQQLDQVMNGIYSAFHIDDMLKTKVKA